MNRNQPCLGVFCLSRLFWAKVSVAVERETGNDRSKYIHFVSKTTSMSKHETDRIQTKASQESWIKVGRRDRIRRTLALPTVSAVFVIEAQLGVGHDESAVNHQDKACNDSSKTMWHHSFYLSELWTVIYARRRGLLFLHIFSRKTMKMLWKNLLEIGPN